MNLSRVFNVMPSDGDRASVRRATGTSVAARGRRLSRPPRIHGDIKPTLLCRAIGVVARCNRARNAEAPPAPLCASPNKPVHEARCAHDADQYLHRRRGRFPSLAVDVAGVGTLIVSVPMLKEGEANRRAMPYRRRKRNLGHIRRQAYRARHQTLPPRRSSPSRTRDCSTSCASV